MNLKRVLLFFSFIFSVLVLAQVQNPVKFQFDVKDLGKGEYEAVLTAKMEDKWHIYSQDLPPDSGFPTEFKLSSKEGITTMGKVLEIGKKHDEYSEAFGAQIVYYANQVLFKQKFKAKNPDKDFKVAAEITYQVCNDRLCLAPTTLEFEKTVKSTTAATTEEVKPEAATTAQIDTASVAIPEANGEVAVVSPTTSGHEKELKINSLDFKNPLTNCGTVQENTGGDNNWLILALGFLGGLIALLTPCVFPMIPLTVSFFTKGSKDKAKGKRDAFIYGFFILLIFVLLSIPFHIIDGISGNIFNQISTNIWLNLFFFVIFIFFAFSFFGYYEITLPNWVANKSSKAEEAGGIIGIFFMALTLVIVSFSCTGPILGSLLGGVVTGSSNVPTLLTFALAGFGIAWALVFGLLALFPQALQSLPKSGGWMNTVKVVLGFIEVALALKFLSKADLVSKTFMLKRELFIVLWILITIGLVLYLFGKIRFPHDDKEPKISLGRKLLGVLGLGFLGYLIYGLIPADKPKLQLLSGILPPMNVSYFHKEEDGILGLKLHHNYFDALEEAKKQNKPLLIDFTGYGCENCRKMEEFVWSQDDILPLLQNDVVIASVYVDDKEELPEAEQMKIDMGGGQMKKIKTIGDKWSMFQQVNFNNNSQPHYVLVTPDQKVINTPVSGYMPKEDFKKFLECGINYHKKN
ncbi:cytochrome c biogenesis protein CcdA [Soonwooa sp.]|uniref:protein-disulfide reductase DsbD family protein n=1 Tax=Soonwooa sp. TaxID=1938592 RepID=UPI0028A5A088|nr:cytochrome c biogenesis protein CcdA [Soonwooa sp.]